jgi:FkbM family methyltransferase
MSLLVRLIKQAIKPTDTGEQIATQEAPPKAVSPAASNTERTLEFKGRPIRFATPNPMTAWRVDSFYTKEPDTVAWLENMPRGSIFLDVGANVGMYSLAAAIGKECTVYAFEPESQNYALLNRNIALNVAQDRVLAFCAALTDKASLSKLFLSNFDSGGGSCHSFGEEVGFDLTPRESPFSQGCVGVTIDELVANGTMPVPNYIKIDVDGFEHKVIAGAKKTLRDPAVNEILIEINLSIPEHRQLIDLLATFDFHFNPDQQRRAQRSTGAFQGVGEIIFKRIHRESIDFSYASTPSVCDTKPADAEIQRVLDHVLDRIKHSPINTDPFPHIVVDDFFPKEYFETALRNFPSDEQMIPLSETGRTAGYPDRLVTLFNDDHFSRLDVSRREFWGRFAGWLYSKAFIDGVIEKFWPYVAGRLHTLNTQHKNVRLHGDALIVSDKSNYAIGPHTDALHRLVTFLFYLPETDDWRNLGTSIYKPLDPKFECDGSKHHLFDAFERVTTVDFLPNRALLFVRSNHSFHGVERISTPNPVRHLVINNIRIAHP